MLETAYSDALERLLNFHLSGSGWDYKWDVELLNNGKFKCTTRYHPMDEHGSYDPSFGVNLTLNLFLEIQRLSFSADTIIRKKYIIGQETYYHDCVCQALSVITSQFASALDDIVGKLEVVDIQPS